MDSHDRKNGDPEWLMQAIFSSRMAALGEMSAGVAHEINNPLAVILGKSQLLQSKMAAGEVKPADVLESVKKIEKMADRIARIIRGLRSFSRDGSGDPFEFKSLGEIIESTTDFCRTRFQNHGVELKVAQIPPNAEVECVAVQLAQVFLHLLNNSFDAIESLERKWIRLECRETEDAWEIGIVDSGGSIPAVIAERMMEPFFTTKEVGNGAGLGLSVAKGVVERHNGRFYFDPACENTRFVVYLPKRQPRAEKAP